MTVRIKQSSHPIAPVVDRLSPRSLPRLELPPLDSFVFCGNPDVSPLDQAVIEARFRALDAERRAAQADAEGVSPPFTPVKIPVHVHVISKGEGAENGDVPAEQVQAQLAHLNETYAGTGFSFELQSVDRTTNRDWYVLETDEAFQAMTSTLHQGGADELNLFVLRPGETGHVLGFSDFPWMARQGATADGVILNNLALPGGPLPKVNEGDVATHEVGHWLGLWHTFQGGCGGVGDEISDTPAHDKPSMGAPEGTDTCSSPGLDPLENFMNYNDNAVMDEFTPEQIARMQAHWQIFRRGGGGELIAQDAMPKAPVLDGQKASSTISIDRDVPFESLKLDFSVTRQGAGPDSRDWKHPSPEDLVVTLKSPSGKEVVLFDRAKETDLTWLSMDVASRFAGEASKGDWTLTVEDTAPNGKDGELYGWGLTFGEGQA